MIESIERRQTDDAGLEHEQPLGERMGFGLAVSYMQRRNASLAMDAL